MPTWQPGLATTWASAPTGAIRAEELSRVLARRGRGPGARRHTRGAGRASRETAEPLARRLNLPVQEVDTASPKRLARRILKDYKGKIVLVVAEADGHTRADSRDSRAARRCRRWPMASTTISTSSAFPGTARSRRCACATAHGPSRGCRHCHPTAQAEFANGFAARSPSAVSGG